MTVKNISVSIVICTHRRFDLLEGAVKSLVNQTASPESYEVIVVDNDRYPNPPVQEIISDASSKIRIRYLHESRVGVSYARNVGGGSARSEYIAYLDDDARANPRHIASLAEICEKYKPDICGGPCYPFYLDAKPAWFKDSYGSNCLYGDVPRYLGPKEYLIGANIVAHRNVLDRVGWFDSCLGPRGNRIWYGDETLVMINAWKANPDLKVYYDPNLFVHHLVPGWKMSMKNLFRVQYMKGQSHAYFWIPEDKRNLFRRLSPCILMVSLVCSGFNVLRGLLSFEREKYPLWQNFALEVLYPEVERIGRRIRLTSDFFSTT